MKCMSSIPTQALSLQYVSDTSVHDHVTLVTILIYYNLMTKLTMTDTSDALTATHARDMIDSTLHVFFMQHVAQAARISPDYETLWRGMHDLINAGGKRIRPYVTLMTYRAFCDKPIADIVPIAAAQELLHLALLVHDDIIDRDFIRYGVDNISGQYNKLYEPLISDESERRHFSNSTAILAGDLLLSSGYELMQTSNVSASDLRIASQIFAHAVFTVAAGELLDTESAFRPFGSVDSIAIANYKTAHYSFVTPITMGARLAGVSDETVEALESFGENIGIAYQLVDDTIGMFGNQTDTGKSNTTDIEEAKRTYLIEQFLMVADDQQKQVFDATFGRKNITAAEADEFKSALIDSGAKYKTDQAIADYTKRAVDCLNTIDMAPSARASFDALIERAIQRDK
jgi:geranylgeranyl diphosphate synthase, type II